MAAEAAVKPATLAECVQTVKEVWSSIERNNTAHLERLGRSLVEARKLVPKGRWQKFVRANFDFSPGAAHRWMELAKAVDAEPQRKFERLSDVNPSWGWGGKGKAARQQAQREERERVRRAHAERLGRFKQMRDAANNDTDRSTKQGLHTDMVTLGYRAASKKYHPDNRETGDKRKFQLLTEVRDRMMKCMYCGYHTTLR